MITLLLRCAFTARVTMFDVIFVVFLINCLWSGEFFLAIVSAAVWLTICFLLDMILTSESEYDDL